MFGNSIIFRPQVKGRRHALCWVSYTERAGGSAASTATGYEPEFESRGCQSFMPATLHPSPLPKEDSWYSILLEAKWTPEAQSGWKI
jgi:hypothetical protein